jgi:hypothetical protein
MQLQAIKSIDAITTTCLHVKFNVGNDTTTTLEIHLLPPNYLGLVFVDAKVLHVYSVKKACLIYKSFTVP